MNAKQKKALRQVEEAQLNVARLESDASDSCERHYKTCYCLHKLLEDLLREFERAVQVAVGYEKEILDARMEFMRVCKSYTEQYGSIQC